MHIVSILDMPDISNGKASDFFIQVLMPIQGGVIGSINLNLAMQESFNVTVTKRKYYAS